VKNKTTIIKKMYMTLLKSFSALALVVAIVDVNALHCFGVVHQPKLPKSADKLKLK